MPYIKKDAREKFSTLSPVISDEGELNYCITKLCNDFLNSVGKKYKTLNTVIGVLECAKQEFYRRIVSSYEDQKIIENGDVYQ